MGCAPRPNTRSMNVALQVGSGVAWLTAALDGVVDAIRAAVGEVDAVALAAMPTLDVSKIVRPGGAVASVFGFGDPDR